MVCGGNSDLRQNWNFLLLSSVQCQREHKTADNIFPLTQNFGWQ